MKTPADQSNEENHQSIEEIDRLTNGLSKTIVEKEDAASNNDKEVQTNEINNEIITSAAQVEQTCQLTEIDLDNNSGQQQQQLPDELVPNTGPEQQQKKNSDMSQTIPITNGEPDNKSSDSRILTNDTRAIAQEGMSPIITSQPAYPIESTIHFTIYDTPLKTPVSDDSIKFRKTNSLELTTFGIETAAPSGDNRQSEPMGLRQVDSQIMIEEEDKPKLRKAKEFRNQESNEPETNNNPQPAQFVAHYQCVLGLLFIILIVLIIFFVKMFIKNDNSGDNSNTTTPASTSS